MNTYNYTSLHTESRVMLKELQERFLEGLTEFHKSNVVEIATIVSEGRSFKMPDNLKRLAEAVSHASALSAVLDSLKC